MQEPQGPRASTLVDLRASDAERAEVADLLATHFTAGRLDRAELDERLAAALGATTRGELAVLLRDLPRIVPERAVQPSPRRRTRQAIQPIAALCLLAFLLLALVGSLATVVHGSASVAHAQFVGRQTFLVHRQRVVSVPPVLVVALLGAIAFLAVRLARRPRGVENQ